MLSILNSNPAIWQTFSLYININPGLFSVFCVLISACDTDNSFFYVVQILSIFYFCQVHWTHGNFKFYDTYGISMFSFPRNSSSIKVALVGID